jgi:hypothetical protein
MLTQNRLPVSSLQIRQTVKNEEHITDIQKAGFADWFLRGSYSFSSRVHLDAVAKNDD